MTGSGCLCLHLCVPLTPFRRYLLDPHTPPCCPQHTPSPRSPPSPVMGLATSRYDQRMQHAPSQHIACITGSMVLLITTCPHVPQEYIRVNLEYDVELVLSSSSWCSVVEWSTAPLDARLTQVPVLPCAIDATVSGVVLKYFSSSGSVSVVPVGPDLVPPYSSST